MKLPNLENAVVSQEKIVNYLLNPEHPDGAGKAKFFAAQGFRPEDWETLADALRGVAAVNDVVYCKVSSHGSKYVVDGPMETPAGRSPWPLVRTVWIIDEGTTLPRLVTAYPTSKESESD
ncbi:MAG: hypothetical protein KatS3mg105_5001 [Gemmatales bacterium]|nr:MAG: hypothetical protein KatS3mg105_5001 [Gemmatales bacterium]